MTLKQQEEANLDKIAAPCPDQNPEEKSLFPRKLLEASHKPAAGNDTPKNDEKDLTEVAAPPPIQEDESGEWRKGEHLESPESGGVDCDVPAAKGQESELSEIATLLYTISYLVLFSILGVLARLGIQWLTFYPGAPIVIDNLWANVAGTLVMGFLSEDRKLFQQEWGTPKKADIENGGSAEEQMSDQDAMKAHGKVKKTIPLFIGLATGFCGSFTSFSTFMRDVFFALSNNLPTPIDHPVPPGHIPQSSDSTIQRNGGYSVMAVLAVILLTVTMCIGALIVGAQLASATHKYTPVIPFRIFRKVVDPISVFIAFGCWLGAVFLVIWPPDRPDGPSSRGPWRNEVWRGEVLFAIAFAPLGCLARWYTSLKLNGLKASFPIGTFAVNMFGIAVEAMCYDLQHVPLASASHQVGGGRVSCQVLQGVMDGFCGALTTVSTWAVELNSLRRQHAYFYGATSVCLGLALMTIIMGSVAWTIGWQSPVCVT